MIIFPNAKINLGLNVINKRPDGFHSIESIFYPIGMCDVLEIQTIHKGTGENSLNFTGSGSIIDVEPDKNLCVKAFHLMKEKFGIPFISIHLHKVLPVGAGLGGGSSDAAFTILALNKLFNLQLSTIELIDLSSEIGSDCAFFILNKPCFAERRGEILTPLNLTLNGYYMVLANPGVHVDTKEAYSHIKPARPEVSLRELTARPVNEWKTAIRNDFEEMIGDRFPVVKELIQLMYNAGAVYAAMSGSGSSVYGIFNDLPDCFNEKLEELIIWKEKLTC